MIRYIYIPGLNDRFDFLRRLALRRWETENAKATLVPMRWSDKSETYEQKYQRLEDVITMYKDDEIVLVGESAGGPMALLALLKLEPQISQVITICGYNHGADDIEPYRRRNNPAFYAMVRMTDALLPKLTSEIKAKIITVYSRRDHVVAPEHSRIEGSRELALDLKGHTLTIARQLISGPKNWLSNT